VEPRPVPSRYALAFVLLIAAALPGVRDAAAQSASPAQTDAPAVIPPELSETARRAYAEGLKEAKALIAREDYAAAAKRIDALLETRPREPQARFLKGVLETAQGKDDVAIATFRALTEDYPEIPEPYNNLAVLYAKKGDYNGARLALETALAAAPDFAVAHENLGDIYVRLAAENYERAAKLDPANKTAPAKLVLARQLLGTK